MRYWRDVTYLTPLNHSRENPTVSGLHVGISEAQGGATMGWEQLPALCIYLTPPPFNSSVYPLEKKCMLLLLFYSQKPVLLVSLSQPVDGVALSTLRFLLLQPGATT